MHWKKVLGFLLLVTLPLASIAALAGYRGPSLAAWSVVMLVGNGVLCLQRASRARRRAADHRDLEAGAALAPLREGECVLEGEVAYADGAELAMRVDFEQVGTESESSGSWSHSWTETHRKSSVRPFYLVRADGTRLRVEPTPGQSQLFDELESKILVPQQVGPVPTRVRFATLVPGERIWITGRLEHGLDPEQSGAAAAAGYRQGAPPTSWIVRGHPLIVSSVSLAAHFAGRARLHLQQAGMVAVLLLLPLAMLARYADRLAGITVVAQITSVSNLVDDDNHVNGYRANATSGSRRLESESLDVAPEAGTWMEFRVGSFSDNPGPAARFTEPEMVLCFGIALGAVLLKCVLAGLSAGNLPWYRSERVKITDSGSGKLFPNAR